jgi:hypothetical protein
MKMLVENVICGGITCNDTIMHAAGKPHVITVCCIVWFAQRYQKS